MKPRFSMPTHWSMSSPDLDAVQAWEVDCLQRLYDEGVSSALVHASVGTGKTVLAAKWARHIEGHGARMLFVAHLDTLVRQAEEKFRRWSVNFQTEHGRRKVKPASWSGGVPHAIASRDTLHEGRIESFLDRAFPGIDEVHLAIDEAHLMTRPETESERASSYWRIIQALCARFRRVFVFGLSGSPWRMDGRALVGPNAPFDVLACRYPLLTACRHGNLAPPVYLGCDCGVDLSRVKITRLAGCLDYDRSMLAARIGESLESVANVIRTKMEEFGIRRLLYFAPDVGVAHAASSVFGQMGISSRAVSGDSPDRDGILRDYHEGMMEVLCSCDLLGVGFDDPPTDGVVPCPTQSTVKAIQQAGRGARLSAGKLVFYVIGFDWKDRRGHPVSTLDLLLRGEPDPEVRRHALAIGTSNPRGLNILEVLDEAKRLRAEELAEERRKLLELPVRARRRDVSHSTRVIDPLEAVPDSDLIRMAVEAGMERSAAIQADPLYLQSMVDTWYHRKKTGQSTLRQVEFLVRKGRDQRWRRLGLTRERCMEMTSLEAQRHIAIVSDRKLKRVS